MKTRSFELDTLYLPLQMFILFKSSTFTTMNDRAMHPANGETTTTTETPHTDMSWTTCYDDGCFMHLSDKHGDIFSLQNDTKTTPAQEQEDTPGQARQRT